MTDAKLDIPPAPIKRVRREDYLSPNTKLDLPGTGAEFAELSGLSKEAIAQLDPKPFSFRSSGTAISNAAGVATIDFGEPPIGWEWRVERLGVKGAGTATVYVGAVQDNQFSDFTPTATQDIADEASPIWVPAGENLLVQFTGAGVGTICVAIAQVRAIPV